MHVLSYNMYRYLNLNRRISFNRIHFNFKLLIMSQEKANEKEWETWMDNLIIEDIFQKENIPFYQYSEFQNVKLITTNIFKATFKISQKTVALKNVYLNDNDKFTLDNLINEVS